MARTPRLTPLEVFEETIADAEQILNLARLLRNDRTRAMRTELRETFGQAMGVRRRDRAALDCVESHDLFIVLKPGRKVSRESFTENALRPLLRQAIVAIAAAIESYVSEKAKTFIGDALRQPERPPRLERIPITLGALFRIEEGYERKSWGHRRVIQEHLEREASPHPDKIGETFAVVGKRKFWGSVNNKRGMPTGTSEKELTELYARRNRIAHAGDLQGRGKAPLALEEVDGYLSNARSIVEALDSVL